MLLPRTSRRSFDPGPVGGVAGRCPRERLRGSRWATHSEVGYSVTATCTVAVIMRQNHEDKQHSKEDGRNHKESEETKVVASFVRNVRQVCEGGLRRRTMYFREARRGLG